MPSQIQIALLYIDVKINLTARCGDEPVCRKIKITGNTGEQLAWLRVRVVPQRVVALCADITRFNQIAI